MPHRIARKLFALGAAACALLMAGCFASPLTGSEPEQALIDAGEYELIERLHVPPVRGVKGCGAQALATVLAHDDSSVDARQLADELPWHDLGATPIDLLLAARAHGSQARIVSGTIDDLSREIHAGHPVLVMIDAAYEVRTLTGSVPTPRSMHWSVVSGVAHDGSRILLAAEDARHHIAGREDFLARWALSDRCMIVVTSPPTNR